MTTTKTRKLSREDILAALQAGAYEIRAAGACDCEITWDIADGELTPDVYGDNCWQGMTLYVHDQAIAEDVLYGDRSILYPYEAVITKSDISEDVWDEMTTSGNPPCSDAHHQASRKALIDFVGQLRAGGWRFFRADERGFANEYTIFLVAPTRGEVINEDWDKIDDDADVADDILYDGDDITEAHNSVTVLR